MYKEFERTFLLVLSSVSLMKKNVNSKSGFTKI